MSYHASRRRSVRPRPVRQSRPTASRRGAKKITIDPRRFIKVAQPVKVEAYQAQHAFTEFALAPLLQHNLQAKGFTPTPIQDQAIAPALEGHDVLGIANTGTGKTLAFALPLLTLLMRHRQSRALVMAPTRELAQQIEAECRTMAQGSGLRGAVLIGGTAMGPQLKELRQRPQIIIGTPGRIKDHLQQGSLNLKDFNLLVLDEVDRMLDMGFIRDMRFILGELPAKRQSLFFSATLDDEVRTLINDFSKEYVTISVKQGETSDNVHQDIIYAKRGQKMELLHDALIKEGVAKTLVFHDTKRGAERLSKQLKTRGFQAEAIHGGKSQGQRQRALDRFKKDEVNVLVATDVAARGIDVAGITHVINYSTPQSYEDYTHRIGRAGRAGRVGHALTFIDEPDDPTDQTSSGRADTGRQKR